jgi:hypothetical protein
MATAIETRLAPVATQLQLSSPLGRFLQYMAKSLFGSGAASPQFLVAQRVNTDQTLVGVNTKLVLNGLGASRGIDYDAVNGLATLTPGKTYRLTMIGEMHTFSDATTGEIDVQFVDDNDAPLASNSLDSMKGVWVPSTSTSGSSGSNGLTMVHTVPLGASQQESTVKLRCMSGSGTATLPAGRCVWTIEEVPG